MFSLLPLEVLSFVPYRVWALQPITMKFRTWKSTPRLRHLLASKSISESQSRSMCKIRNATSPLFMSTLIENEPGCQPPSSQQRITPTEYDRYHSLCLIAMNLSWVRPTSGEVYKGGDSIICEWRTNRTILSPSIRLCAAQAAASHGYEWQNNCGAIVHPPVNQQGNTFQTTL